MYRCRIYITYIYIYIHIKRGTTKIWMYNMDDACVDILYRLDKAVTL